MTCPHCQTENPIFLPFSRPVEGGRAYAQTCIQCGRILGMRPRLEEDDSVSPPPTCDNPRTVPSNPVYARVGDDAMLSAHDGVRRGLTPYQIIGEILTKHRVRLNMSELHLLLASRRI